MFIKADFDSFGNIESFTSDKFRHILDLLDGYMKVPYIIHEIRQDDIKDPHGRIDIEIRFNNENGILIQQKLLILDDIVIDGKKFHDRFHE